MRSVLAADVPAGWPGGPVRGQHAPGRVEGLTGVAAIAPANHLLGLVRGGATLDRMNSDFAFTPLLLNSWGGIKGTEPGHDTPELTEWPAALLTAAGPRG
ncbi:hypothetical protein [Streptomyces cyaneofuscatus]|uniref:hypothetical protein n=1 Tax=Streptomyces cyaneofuscatus TaxID=66883 RepID=UPI00364AF090